MSDSYARTQRLRLIDSLLEHYGECKPLVVSNLYGISASAMTRDCNKYMELNQGNCSYSAATRSYLKLKTFNKMFV